HFLLGQAYRQSGAYEKAKTCYEAALRIHPNVAEAYFGLFTVCTRLGQKDQADQYREKFQEHRAKIVEAVADRHEAYDDLLVTRQRVGHIFTDVGRYYGAQGDMPKAEELWRRAAILDPKNARCRRQLTALYESASRDREALQVYEELCGIEPENVLFYAHRGVLNTRLKRLDAAEKAFRKMIQIAPQRPEGYSGLAQLHVRRNANVREAKTCAARAVELAPTAKNYSILGIVCQKGGDRPGALAAWKRAVELDPENVEYASIYEQIQQKQ
ncbi:MAG: tetratricopeptide repeat protein, partial [Planctomycetota bacterium]